MQPLYYDHMDKIIDMPKLEKMREWKKKWRERGNNREKEREEQRLWRQNNQNKVKKYHAKDYQKRKQRYLELAKIRAGEHKEEIKHYMYKYNKKRHNAFRMKVLNYYSNNKLECSCCRENILDFLTLDHINNDGAIHRKKVGSAQIYKWLIDNGLPEGYAILCMNCNFAKGLKYNKGVCPHKR